MDYDVEVTIDTRTVKVRELTVRDIRTLLNTEGAGELDVIAESLIEGVSFNVLETMTDLDVKALEDMKPSQIEKVVESCREVNQSFFVMIQKWLDVKSEAEA